MSLFLHIGQSRFGALAGLIILLLIALPASGEPSPKREMNRLIEDLGSRCASYGWNDVSPRDIPWQSHRTSHLKRAMIFAQFGPSQSDCTLFLGGIHGDEIPTVYVTLKLAHYIKDNPSVVRDKCIIIAPLVNPDGFFSNPPRRVNARGVDLNRNFPTREWSSRALREWQRKHGGNKRYYPGRKGGSETETMFQVALIKRYRPGKILAVHSPLNVYDFDGPSSDLDSFSNWLEKISEETGHPLKRFGFFPGSLGNYAGQERAIFTLTLELPTSDPGKGNAYFRQFQPALVKFLNLPLSISPPTLRTSSYSVTERGR